MDNPLAELGVSDVTAARLEAFGNAPRPSSLESFHDSSPAGAVTLTIGQVQVLRGALRGTMLRFFQTAETAVAVSRMTGAPIHTLIDTDQLEREIINVLNLEDVLAPVWAEHEAKELGFSIPDAYPDGLL